jgi:hypothetical protein
MRATKLLGQLTIYYAVIGLLLLVAVKLWPDFRGYLPIGGVESLITQPSQNPLEGSEAIRAQHVGNMAVRSGEEYDQSLVNTILVLPMVVTGIVIIVQNSLALAFALAGIAGAVRFRNSLKSSGDALFILISVAIGLSAGIGAVELAAVISIALNYTFAMLWLTEYGERKGMKRYLADYDGIDEAAPPAPEKTSEKKA